MTKEEIISKIQNGLKQLSIENSIPFNRVAVRITLKVSPIAIMSPTGVNCLLMDDNVLVKKDEKVVPVSLEKLFGLKPMEALFVSGKLCTLLKNLSSKNKIDQKSANARIYTASEDFTPLIHLFNLDESVCSVSIDDLGS